MKYVYLIIAITLSVSLNAQISGKFTHKRIMFDFPMRISDTTVIAESIFLIDASYTLTSTTLLIDSNKKVHRVMVKGLKSYKFAKNKKESRYDYCYRKIEYDDDDNFIRSIDIFVKGSKIIQVKYRCAGNPYIVVYE